jgi:hypothetical protein
MDDPKLKQEVPMAVVGIVPCKVSAENGAIEVGDLLVASFTPGHAMKGTDRSKMLGGSCRQGTEAAARRERCHSSTRHTAIARGIVSQERPLDIPAAYSIHLARQWLVVTAVNNPFDSLTCF